MFPSLYQSQILCGSSPEKDQMESYPNNVLYFSLILTLDIKALIFNPNRI